MEPPRLIRATPALRRSATVSVVLVSPITTFIGLSISRTANAAHHESSARFVQLAKACS